MRLVKSTAAKASHELLQPMVKVAEMVERHLDGILGHWQEGLTTALLARLPQFGVRKKNFSGGGGHKCEQIEWCENDLMRKGTCSAEQAVAGLGSGSAEWGHVFATAASDDQRRDV